MPDSQCRSSDVSIRLMTEYVTEMSGRLALNVAASASFQAAIHGLLASCYLPEATVLLGMVYFSREISRKKHIIARSKNRKLKLHISEYQVWQLLVVAIILGSKYLDDNTFENCSWAMASGVPTAKLNMLEREWLATVQWGLFVDLDSDKDYNAWARSWNSWLVEKNSRLKWELSTAGWFPATKTSAIKADAAPSCMPQTDLRLPIDHTTGRFQPSDSASESKARYSMSGLEGMNTTHPSLVCIRHGNVAMHAKDSPR